MPLKNVCQMKPKRRVSSDIWFLGAPFNKNVSFRIFNYLRYLDEWNIGFSVEFVLHEYRAKIAQRFAYVSSKIVRNMRQILKKILVFAYFFISSYFVKFWETILGNDE